MLKLAGTIQQTKEKNQGTSTANRCRPRNRSASAAFCGAESRVRIALIACGGFRNSTSITTIKQLFPSPTSLRQGTFYDLKENKNKNKKKIKHSLVHCRLRTAMCPETMCIQSRWGITFDHLASHLSKVVNVVQKTECLRYFLTFTCKIF